MAKIEGDAAISRFITAYLTGNMRGKFLYTEHSSFINLSSEILSVGGADQSELPAGRRSRLSGLFPDG